MSGPAARIMIATPTYTGQLYAEYVKSLTAAWVYCLYHQVELELNVADGYSLVQFARNRLAQDLRPKLHAHPLARRRSRLRPARDHAAARARQGRRGRRVSCQVVSALVPGSRWNRTIRRL